MWQVELEQRDVLVDLLVELQQFHHAVYQSDAAAGDRFLSLGNFIVNIARCNFRLLVPIRRSSQAYGNTSLASFQLASYVLLHSKALRAVRLFLVCYYNKRINRREFSSFFVLLHNSSNKGTLD